MCPKISGLTHINPIILFVGDFSTIKPTIFAGGVWILRERKPLKIELSTHPTDSHGSFQLGFLSILESRAPIKKSIGMNGIFLPNAVWYKNQANVGGRCTLNGSK